MNTVTYSEVHALHAVVAAAAVAAASGIAGTAGEAITVLVVAPCELLLIASSVQLDAGRRGRCAGS